ncbi:MAG: amidohydrolase [Firmicutes bacterium]|nr:amidohydrolase [Bacillota bacterium]MBQ6260612.1 amidohydrolase [Bacillota bacterium]
MDVKVQDIKGYIDSIKDEIDRLALDIHAHPELCYEEYTAMNLVADLCEKHGYKVQRGYAGVETSMRADAEGQPGGPRVAFLAEYDALPGCGENGAPGHGCGHNLIAACSTAAFLALASVIKDYKGSVCLIGTPAEEGGGGKIKLLANGGFDDVNYAMMMHPSSGGVKANLVGRGGRASCDVTVKFFGKAAHSSRPVNGINALNGVISLFNHIDMLRPTFDPQDNINGIINHGGVASNIIPDFAEAEFCVRADTMHRIEELIAIIEKCAQCSSALTGARYELTHGDISAERYPNRPMNQAFKDAMEEQGIQMCWPDPRMQYGSSDVGNVSIVMPIIHDYLSITDDRTVQAHNPSYTVAACQPEALEIARKGAVGLAAVGYKLLSDEAFRAEADEYHRNQIPDFYKK